MLLSTRLFPRKGGAKGYLASGIAARCDWVLFSDWNSPQTHLRRYRVLGSPRHVFLSLRAPFPALAAFVNDVLPLITEPFVLVSGSEDCTIPKQIDHRWREFSADEDRMIKQVLDHPLLLRWFAENLVDASDPRFSPLPVGMVTTDGRDPVVLPDSPPLQKDRPLTVLCGHRVRDGAQWETRRTVTGLARGPWQQFCTVPEIDLPEPEFLELMRSHAFVLCAEGGGVDPSPKAWTALLNGAIPIIRRTATAAAYANLPVAFVEHWDAQAITPGRLNHWSRTFAPFHDDPDLRAQTCTRLGLDFWWAQIAQAARA